MTKKQIIEQKVNSYSEVSMKKPAIFLAQFLVFSFALLANTSYVPASAPAKTELGKWWKNSEIVKKLKLSETQIDQIEQSFLSYRPALANLTAELKNREEVLRTLMQADRLDESRISSQTELIAASRAELEKTNAAMMLAIRKDLTREQWEKLQEIQELRRASAAFPVTTGPAARRQHAPKANMSSAQSGDRIYTVGEDSIVPPKCLYHPLPHYTQEARDAKVEGIIMLQAVIRKTGQITDIKVLRSIGYGLDESAIETLSKEWKFEPGTLKGRPVDIQANIEVSFRLY
jgi:TonB family protein